MGHRQASAPLLLPFSRPREGHKTEPVDNVKYLYETKRSENAIIVSTSEPIPAKGTAEDEDKESAPPGGRQLL